MADDLAKAERRVRYWSRYPDEINAEDLALVLSELDRLRAENAELRTILREERPSVGDLILEATRHRSIAQAATRFIKRNYTGSLGPDDLGWLLNDINELACVVRGAAVENRETTDG